MKNLTREAVENDKSFTVDVLEEICKQERKEFKSNTSRSNLIDIIFGFNYPLIVKEVLGHGVHVFTVQEKSDQSTSVVLGTLHNTPIVPSAPPSAPSPARVITAQKLQNPIAPRRFGALSVECFGQVTENSFVDKYIYPIGYKATRTFNGITYHLAIIEKDNKLTFCVSPADAPEKMVEHSSPSGACIKAVKAATGEAKSISGPVWYGLSVPEIRQAIRQRQKSQLIGTASLLKPHLLPMVKQAFQILTLQLQVLRRPKKEN
jgi:hypothetical protein